MAGPGWRSARLLAAGLPPLVALAVTAGTLRFLVPPPFEAGSPGFWAWVARVTDREPLILGVALFLPLLLAASYWWRKLAGHDGEPPANVSLVRAALALLILAVVASAVRARVFEISRVSGASMEPTLNPGDRVLVNKLAYGLRLPLAHRAFRATPPRRGDLIVFPDPDRAHTAAEPASIVKRVIGLPGDEIAFADGSPVINGWVVPACDAGPFLIADGTRTIRGRLAIEVLAGRAYLTLRSPFHERSAPRVKVPPGELFVLGDDRPTSRDSRSWNDGRGGGVAVDRVEGRVSRLAATVGGNGRLDFSRSFRGLRPALRGLNIDVTRLDNRIAACLAHQPRQSWPPDRPL